jgi:hypothetical protein
VKILAINPGASYSTVDVYNGYVAAWQAQGHEVTEYALDRRIHAATHWLGYQYRHGQIARQAPTPLDVRYLASFESLILALNQDIDWVVVFSGGLFHSGVFHAFRKAGLKTAIILTESPYEDNRQAPWAVLSTVAFTNERTSVEWMRRYNERAYYLPHAYDPARHYPQEDGQDVAAHDVVFVGTDWPERRELLSAVNWEGIDLGLYGLWKGLPSRHPLRRHLHRCIVDNATTAALYRRAAIGLNPYRQSVMDSPDSPRISTAESLNPRALELAACGCFAISDKRAEAQEVFGGLVPAYETSQELEDLIRYYLAHPAERREKASRLPEAVQDRTFAALGEQVINTLENSNA